VTEEQLFIISDAKSKPKRLIAVVDLALGVAPALPATMPLLAALAAFEDMERPQADIDRAVAERKENKADALRV